MIGLDARSRRTITLVALCALLGCVSKRRGGNSDGTDVSSRGEARDTGAQAARAGAARASAVLQHAPRVSDRSSPLWKASVLNIEHDGGACMPLRTSNCTVGNAFQEQIASLIRAKWGAADGEGAVRVARCESGQAGTMASNGEYLGLFQMGSSERGRFGYSPCAEHQIAGAYAYYQQSGGWGPWSCKP